MLHEEYGFVHLEPFANDDVCWISDEKDSASRVDRRKFRD